ARSREPRAVAPAETRRADRTGRLRVPLDFQPRWRHESLLKMNITFNITVACGLFWLSFANSALATPRTLPFSYPYETLAKGELELELYTDVNPLRVAADPTDSTAGQLWSP